jgi:phosphohistidine phosphatase
VQVFLVRHAEAAYETLALPDAHRPLTQQGRRQARALGDRLRWHDCDPSHIWSSPRVRAIQTAELLAATLGSETAVEVVAALAPDGPAGDVAAALAELADDAIVVIIGHEPGLSALGALLIGEPALARIAKAEAVRIVDGAVRWRFAYDGETPAMAAR